MRLLQERTGRSAQEWAALTEKEGPEGVAARRQWLKSTHGFTTNYAGWIADLSVGGALDDVDPDAYLRAAEGYVEAMFSGKRAGLRPAYDRLLADGARARNRRQGLPRQDDRAALPRACLRANQAVHQRPNRSRPCAGSAT